MTPRASFRQQFVRDWPLTKVVLAWMAFGCSFLFYFSDWPAVRHHASAATELSVVSVVNSNDAEEIYTGSILLTHPGQDHCWERKFDNRTGAMWNNGPANCRKVTSQENAKRLRALKTFFGR